MTQTEYEHKKRECWEEFRTHVVCGTDNPKGWFERAFDRAYALGKQEKDAEGESVVTWRRKELIRLYKEKVEIKGNARSSQREKDRAIGWCNALRYILQCDFSTDDGMDVAENTTTTQKPTEPKFRLKDKVVRKNVSTIRTIVGINSVSDDTGTSYYYMTEDSNGNNRMDFVESDLEPYTEPKYHPGQKVCYNGYVYEVEGLVGKNRYALKGLNFDLDEDMIEPYTELEEEIRKSRTSPEAGGSWHASMRGSGAATAVFNDSGWK